MSAPITITGAYTCTHHNDAMRAACPVCLVTTLTAERDKLRAQNDQFSDNLSAVGAVYNAEKARAERAEAEAERYRLVTLRQDAELTTERARLDWLLLDVVSRFDDAYYNRAAIDAAMKEGAK